MGILKLFNKLYFYFRAIPKTLFFNFYYLPFSQAIKFPMVVSHRVKIDDLSGKVFLIGQIKTGKIKIGFGKVQYADPAKSRTIWNLQSNGEIYFASRVKLGTGTKINVNGELTFGNGCNFTGECVLICNKKIEFGKNNLVSWGTLIMDSDLHDIVDINNNLLNEDQKISIGDNVWICAKSTILKGVILGSNSIVSANSNLTKSCIDGDVVIGGNPAKVISSMTNKRFCS